jgi:hypothetical protein
LFTAPEAASTDVREPEMPPADIVNGRRKLQDDVGGGVSRQRIINLPSGDIERHR